MIIAEKFLQKVFETIPLVESPALILMKNKEDPDGKPKIGIRLRLPSIKDVTFGEPVTVEYQIKYDSVEEFTDEVLDNMVSAVQSTITDTLLALKKGIESKRAQDAQKEEMSDDVAGKAAAGSLPH